MGWLLVVGIVICICAAIAAASDDEEKKKAAAAAKVPDAFARLFREEFPRFADQITYAKSEQFLRQYHAALSARPWTSRLKLFDKSRFKSEPDRAQALRYLAGATAGEISDDFRTFAINNPNEYFQTIQRVIASTNTLSNQ